MNSIILILFTFYSMNCRKKGLFWLNMKLKERNWKCKYEINIDIPLSYPYLYAQLILKPQRQCIVMGKSIGWIQDTYNINFITNNDRFRRRQKDVHFTGSRQEWGCWWQWQLSQYQRQKEVVEENSWIWSHVDHFQKYTWRGHRCGCEENWKHW